MISKMYSYVALIAGVMGNPFVLFDNNSYSEKL